VSPIGVLVMAHGTPANLDDVARFYTEIRRGRAPSPEQLAELRGRYEAIGGTSPLIGRTRAQVDAIGAVLERDRPGVFRVELGMKFAAPRIEDGVSALRSAGVSSVVGLVLAPHSSVVSVGEYVRRARKAARVVAAPDGAGVAAAADSVGADGSGPSSLVPITVVDHWYDAPGFAAMLDVRVTAALRSLPGAAAPTPEAEAIRAGATVLFTAHSVPVRVVEAGDDYPEQVRASAEAVAAAAGIERWTVAWQSAGRTAEPWLGPDLRPVITSLAGSGSTGVVVCPIGFVSDHLEVLYDVDIEARAVADAAGIPLVRTASLNDDPRLAELLAAVVLRAPPAETGRP
jgi:protoporphyrin/coproporphyrin ferrochelatase